MWLLFLGFIVVGAVDEECFDCSLDYGWECRKQKRIWIQDVEVPTPFKDRALMTLPDGFVVKRSNIPNAGLGVFTTKNISKCVVLGPYAGERLDDPDIETDGYAWIISDEFDEPASQVDAVDPRTSNWLRYINCPMTEDTGNLVVQQYKGDIYLQVKTAIPAGTEMLVWYGDDYAAELGLIDAKDKDEL